MTAAEVEGVAAVAVITCSSVLGAKRATAPGGGCELDFSVDFEFNNRVFERLAGLFFHDAFKRMVSAFESRAAAIYGAPLVSPGAGISSSSATSAA